MQLIMRDINKGTLKNKYSWDQIFSLVLHQNQNILVRNYPFHWIKSHWNYSCASRQIDTYCWLSFLNFSIILIIWLIFLQETSKFFTVYWFAFFFFWCLQYGGCVFLYHYFNTICRKCKSSYHLEFLIERGSCLWNFWFFFLINYGQFISCKEEVKCKEIGWARGKYYIL